MTDIFSALGNVATAIGVILVAWQLCIAHRQNVTTFEDSLAREYREIAAKIPVEAFFGEVLTHQAHQGHLDDFYRYFDLCNEQAFLHQRKRIRRSTWKFWRDGMSSNFRRPAFARAWGEICARDQFDFSELRALFPPQSPQNLAEQLAA